MSNALDHLHSDFPMNYTLEIGALSTPGDRTIWFPPDSSDGATARVRHASGLTWFGYFPPDRWSVSGFALCSTPDPDNLLYCSGSHCILVPTNKPEHFRTFDTSVECVIAAPDAKLLLISDGVRISATDGKSLVWQSSRISWDGFDGLESRGHTLHGLAWDAPNDDWREFTLDLRTQTVSGGAYDLE